MNIDKLIAAIPSLSIAERAEMRAKATGWLKSGTPDQKAAAEKVLAALDAFEMAESAALYEHLRDLPVAQRVVEAFKVAPMSDNERKTIQALLDHPGATTTELSRACGHDSMIWQMHFGNLCKDRQAYLWPAEKAENRDGHFFSGILAEVDPATNRFTMKPDVAAAFAELGLRVSPW
jgi:hypothetical protein